MYIQRETLQGLQAHVAGTTDLVEVHVEPISLNTRSGGGSRGGGLDSSSNNWDLKASNKLAFSSDMAQKAEEVKVRDFRTLCASLDKYLWTNK